MSTLLKLGATIRDFIALSWLKLLLFITVFIALIWFGTYGIDAHDDLLSSLGAVALFLFAPIMATYAVWFAFTATLNFIGRLDQITQSKDD
jgi:hypothetical protein